MADTAGNRAHIVGKIQAVSLEQRASFLEALRHTGVVQRAIAQMRPKPASPSTLYFLRRNDPEFARAWDQALDDSVHVLEDEAVRRAVEGTERGIYYRGDRVAVEREYSDGLLQFLLKGRSPRYRDRVDHEVGGSVRLIIETTRLGDNGGVTIDGEATPADTHGKPGRPPGGGDPVNRQLAADIYELLS